MVIIKLSLVFLSLISEPAKSHYVYLRKRDKLLGQNFRNTTDFGGHYMQTTGHCLANGDAKGLRQRRIQENFSLLMV